MTTVDNLLTNLNNFGFDNISSPIPKKDLKVLVSLSTSVCLPSFITENQSKLLVKILTEHADTFSPIEKDIKTILAANTWSKPFRIVEQVRKIYISTARDEFPKITVEFTHSVNIRKALLAAVQANKIELTNTTPKIFTFPFTEKNIAILLDTLRPFKFEIDETLKNYLEIIKKWKVDEVRHDYTLDEKIPENMKKSLENELGPGDRSLRFVATR